MKNNIVISLIVGIVFAIIWSIVFVKVLDSVAGICIGICLGITMAVCSSLILTKSGQNKKINNFCRYCPVSAFSCLASHISHITRNMSQSSCYPWLTWKQKSK